MEAVEVHFDNEALKTMIIDSSMICKLTTRGENVFPSCRSVEVIVQTKQLIYQQDPRDFCCLRVRFHASSLSSAPRVLLFPSEFSVTLIEFHDNNREISMT